jgi:hypothetical protein
MIVDLKAYDKDLPHRSDDNEAEVVEIVPGRGFKRGNVTIVSKRAARILVLLTPAERTAVMDTITAH